jgi:hypothetical protein
MPGWLRLVKVLLAIPAFIPEKSIWSPPALTVAAVVAASLAIYFRYYWPKGGDSSQQINTPTKLQGPTVYKSNDEP